uniref:SH2 domain-containing protein n=1 Tax=Panagrolaimus sp. ES5 TaxID=591445 RepID=A0AC34GD17_9BILA
MILLAKEFKEILGELLITAPLTKNETHLPCPAALRKKIIIKHKKLQIDHGNNYGDDDEDILTKAKKRGILYLYDDVHHHWTRHIFVVLEQKLCYIADPIEDANEAADGGKEKFDKEKAKKEEPENQEYAELNEFGFSSEEMHITEEWYHGNIDARQAAEQLLKHVDKGDGLYLVRKSATLIGNFVLSV